MRKLVCVFVLALVTALAASVADAAAPLRTKTFRTPSKNISCAYYPASVVGRVLFRCDVRSGLRPKPKRSCPGDWTGAAFNLYGHAAPTCAGDTVYDPQAPVLAYGRAWTFNLLRCISRVTGLTCRNRDRHGFFLSRQSWRIF